MAIGTADTSNALVSVVFWAMEAETASNARISLPHRSRYRHYNSLESPHLARGR